MIAYRRNGAGTVYEAHAPALNGQLQYLHDDALQQIASLEGA